MSLFQKLKAAWDWWLCHVHNTHVLERRGDRLCARCGYPDTF